MYECVLPINQATLGKLIFFKLDIDLKNLMSVIYIYIYIMQAFSSFIRSINVHDIVYTILLNYRRLQFYFVFIGTDKFIVSNKTKLISST
jgi:hypothetical protein